MQRFFRGQVGERWVAKGCGKVSGARRGLAIQSGGLHTTATLCPARGVTEPREGMTTWCSGSRTEPHSPFCPHHLKSYQGCGPVGSTTKNEGESNLRGKWLLLAATCGFLQQRPTPAAKPTWLFGEKYAQIKLLNSCRWWTEPWCLRCQHLQLCQSPFSLLTVSRGEWGF